VPEPLDAPPTADMPGTDRRVEIVPSVLPADLARLGEEVQALEKAGVDRIQWDVMDGKFVPNLTFGPDVIAASRAHTGVPFEAHLMVDDPDPMLDRYVEAGCGLLIIHAESVRHLHRTLGRVRELGADAAVALNPATPADAVAHVLDLCSMVLVMTVNPGFGGQKYIATMERKVAEVRRMIVAGGWRCDLEVDGGITPETVRGAARAGANVLVSGSGLFKDPQGLEHAVGELRSLAEDTHPAPRGD
jgi:ribulose-phosphate 3-epimerase